MLVQKCPDTNQKSCLLAIKKCHTCVMTTMKEGNGSKMNSKEGFSNLPICG